MSEESPSLALIFRKRLPPEAETQAHLLAKQAAEEAWDFIREAAAQVPFQQFLGRLSLGAFTKYLSLAISDEFEDVTEEARQLLLGQLSLTEARESAEYREIRRLLLERCAELSEPESKEAWMARAEPRARRAIVRAFREADPRDAGRAAEQVLDRSMPKGKLAEEPKPISLDEESADLIERALSRHRKSLGGGDAA